MPVLAIGGGVAFSPFLGITKAIESLGDIV
jgi:hypothetical protein